MAHSEQLKFVAGVKAAFPEFFRSTKTLEIGSLDINGSIRQFFEGGDYVGLDVAQGPGVDVVCQGQDYDGLTAGFDTVISCEVLEHNPHWRETLTNMLWLCRPGGLVLVTCATTARREHGTTRTRPDNSPLTVEMGWDYYLNLSPRDVTRAVPLAESLSPFAIFANWPARDLYLIGFRQGADSPPDAANKIEAIRRFYRQRNIRHGLWSNYFLLRAFIAVFGEERYHAWRARGGN
jgi:SAM-dependent methyltransferase